MCESPHHLEMYPNNQSFHHYRERLSKSRTVHPRNRNNLHARTLTRTGRRNVAFRSAVRCSLHCLGSRHYSGYIHRRRDRQNLLGSNPRSRPRWHSIPSQTKGRIRSYGWRIRRGDQTEIESRLNQTSCPERWIVENKNETRSSKDSS